MNHMGYVTYLQGKYNSTLADVGSTTLEFVIPDSGNVLLMAQSTVFCSDEGSGNHTTGVVFTLFDELNAEQASETAFVKLQDPGHGTVCMTYMVASKLTAGATAKITIARSDLTYGNGGLDGDDYYSVAVVELEQAGDRVDLKAS